MNGYTNYVAGLLFDPTRRQVVLIQKQKPDWQKGYWNGVGGKIEDGETPLGAMIREFEEETGLNHGAWSPFAELSGLAWNVKFYWGVGDVDRCKTVTNEEVKAFNVTRLPRTIYNIRWLIPLAKDNSIGHAFITYQQ